MKATDFNDGDRVYHTRIKAYGTVKRSLANNPRRFVGIEWDKGGPQLHGGYTPDNLEKK